MISDRVRLPSLLNKVVSADEAAALIKDGMVVGTSGFTRAGEAKAVSLALVERAKQHPLKITLMTGASLGNDLDGKLAEAGVLYKRMPFQVDRTLRKAINAGQVLFIDHHLSEPAELLRNQQLPPPDIAIIEAVAITEDGHIVPTTSVGNSATFVAMAKQVIVEISNVLDPRLEGVHDIYLPGHRPNRQPIPLTHPEDRIGTTAIPVDSNKIVAIVESDLYDSPSAVTPPDDETQAIADHIINFLVDERHAGRLPHGLGPLQAGIGTIANAVLTGLVKSPFENLTMYSEVLQDCTFDLFEAGKLRFASGCSMTLSEKRGHEVLGNIDQYKDRIVLRTQETSNHPELIRRLGVIAINTALEFDIYGNVNSTHVCANRMMNGIGGSGDFARNAHMSIFVTKSAAKGGVISSVVPMVSHVDHIPQDVDILVTEHGLADLRDLAPRERAIRVIENCAHPDYRDALKDYFERACRVGGQTPHILREALSWHINLDEQGKMLP